MSNDFFFRTFAVDALDVINVFISLWFFLHVLPIMHFYISVIIGRVVDRTRILCNGNIFKIMSKTSFLHTFQRGA